MNDLQAVGKSKNTPRVVVAALKGGAGKTFLSVGLVAALRKKGLSVAVFKKGPDYIDAGWLGMAAGSSCYNLDPYLFDRNVLVSSFLTRSRGVDVAVIEGNRGIFDGVDSSGSFSTAELAKLLKAPVVLIIDASKTTRTAAAFVLGCRALDPELHIQGVILNRVAGARHETVLIESIERVCSVAVVGSVRKLPAVNFPQRHLGLLPMYEHPKAMDFVHDAAEVAEQCLDLERIMGIAAGASAVEAIPLSDLREESGERHNGLRIGVLRDAAFQFYYPENLEALVRTGAELVELSALENGRLPLLDALYIGGGFPETHAGRLSENLSFRESIRASVANGLPVYAECGGLMYLSRSLRIDDAVYPMVGVFPVDTVLERKPQGHGYMQVEVAGSNPFFPKGMILTGHEFHYSYVSESDSSDASYAFRVLRGHGFDGVRDGITLANALGTYMHIHALGSPEWAGYLLHKAMVYGQVHRDVDGRVDLLETAHAWPD